MLAQTGVIIEVRIGIFWLVLWGDGGVGDDVNV